MAISTRPRTGIPTRTPAAAGRTLVEAQTNPAAQVTTPVLPRAGEGRKRAAGHQRSAEAATEAGDPGRRALAGRRAGAEVEAGAVVVADEPSDAWRKRRQRWLVVLLVKFLAVDDLEDLVCRSQPAEASLRFGSYFWR